MKLRGEDCSNYQISTRISAQIAEKFSGTSSQGHFFPETSVNRGAMLIIPANFALQTCRPDDKSSVRLLVIVLQRRRDGTLSTLDIKRPTNYRDFSWVLA